MLFRALYILESEALDSIYYIYITKWDTYGDTLQLDIAWLEISTDEQQLLRWGTNPWLCELQGHVDFVELNTCIEYISIKILAECVIVY